MFKRKSTLTNAGDQTENEIFISYSNTYRDFADRLASALQEKRRDAWFDQKDMQPGQEWLDQLQQGIRNAAVFLFLLSPEAIVSWPCQFELMTAFEEKVRIIPILYVGGRNKDEVRAEVKASFKAFIDSLENTSAFLPDYLLGMEAKFTVEELKQRYQQVVDDLHTPTITASNFNEQFEILLGHILEDFSYHEKHAQLRQRASAWNKSERNASATLRGRELAEAQTWLAKASQYSDRIGPTQSQIEFITSSRRVQFWRRVFSAGALMLLLSVIAAGLYLSLDAIISDETSKLADEMAVQANSLFAQDRAAGLGMAAAAYTVEANDNTLNTLRDIVTGIDDRLARYLPLYARPNEQIVALAASPVEPLFALGHANGDIDIWSSSTGKLNRQLDTEGLDVDLTYLVFSPDGSLLVASTQTGQIAAWALQENNEYLGSVNYWNHSLPINDLAINADGTRLATASCLSTAETGCQQGLVVLWDLSNRTELTPVGEPYFPYTAAVQHVAFSPTDPSLLALTSAGEGDPVVVWNAATGEEITRLELDTRTPPFDLTFTPDGTALVAGVTDHLLAWETSIFTDPASEIRASPDVTLKWSESQQTLIELGLGAAPTILIPGSDGPMLITADSHRQISLWDLAFESEGPLAVQVGVPLSYGHAASISHIGVGDMGNALISTDAAGESALWYFSGGGTWHTLAQLARDVRDLFLVEDDVVVVTRTYTPLEQMSDDDPQAIITFDANRVNLADETVDVLPIPVTTNMMMAAVRHDLGYAVRFVQGRTTGVNPGVLELLQLSTGDVKLEIPIRSYPDWLLFDGTGTFVAVDAGSRQGVGFWNLRTGQLPDPWTDDPHGDDGLIWAQTFGPVRPDQPTIPWFASGDQHGRVVLWDVASGLALTPAIQHHESSITSLAFSDDGIWLASGSETGGIRLYNLVAEQLVDTVLTADTDTAVRSLAFNASNTWLAAGYADGRVLLWDLAAQRLLTEYYVKLDGAVNELLFLDEGALVAVTSSGAVVRWRVTPVDWVARACTIMGRPFQGFDKARDSVNKLLDDILLVDLMPKRITEVEPCTAFVE